MKERNPSLSSFYSMKLSLFCEMQLLQSRRHRFREHVSLRVLPHFLPVFLSLPHSQQRGGLESPAPSRRRISQTEGTHPIQTPRLPDFQQFPRFPRSQNPAKRHDPPFLQRNALGNVLRQPPRIFAFPARLPRRLFPKKAGNSVNRFRRPRK